MTAQDNDTEADETVQEVLERAMPPNFGISGERSDGDEIRMTHDEQRDVSGIYQSVTRSLLDKGYSETELKIVVSGIEHQLRAGQYDPHEYDRIALSIALHQTVGEWKEKLDDDIPEYEIAHVLRELSDIHMQNAREETARRRGREEARDDNDE